jgi:hypothetical protein
MKAIRLQFCGFVFALLTLTVSCVAVRQNVLRAEDDLQAKTWIIYTQGTFEQATNALTAHFQFIEAHKEQLSESRNVPLLLYLAHDHLAYMLLFSRNESRANEQFNIAYDYYKQMLEQNDLNKPLPKSEFIDYAITGIGKVDAKTGVVWKHELKLDTNVVNDVKVLFVAEHK